MRITNRLRSGSTRREFLGAMGAVAASAAVGFPQPGTRRFVLREDRFGRMFPKLAPFAEPSPGLEAALLEMGKAGGILDARDALDRGPIDLILDPALSAGNPNSSSHTAGITFVGQFLDHDLTFDLASRLGEPAEPADSPNARTPALDLDSVYGGGPVADPELYERAGRGRGGFPTKLRIQSGGLFEDVPRNSDGTAIIADPRNDENLMIAGLQTAFIRFHNRAVDLVTEGGARLTPQEVFRRARRLTTWHYQWIVVHEVLPLFVGQDLVEEIQAGGRRFYRSPVAQISGRYIRLLRNGFDEGTRYADRSGSTSMRSILPSSDCGFWALRCGSFALPPSPMPM